MVLFNLFNIFFWSAHYTQSVDEWAGVNHWLPQVEWISWVQWLSPPRNLPKTGPTKPLTFGGCALDMSRFERNFMYFTQLYTPNITIRDITNQFGWFTSIFTNCFNYLGEINMPPTLIFTKPGWSNAGHNLYVSISSMAISGT